MSEHHSLTTLGAPRDAGAPRGGARALGAQRPGGFFVEVCGLLLPALAARLGASAAARGDEPFGGATRV
ncbi:MAG: hypothetical protein FJ138_19230, partial [Deltaproteobacteria bacterium]|nr:hypothetical protein [Deltaproteobacteria bacterium]